MKFEEIVNAIDLAKVHVEEARQAQTFPDMRIQLDHAETAMQRAMSGIRKYKGKSIGMSVARVVSRTPAKKRRKTAT